MSNVIAVGGKGGVGKTLIVSLLTRILRKECKLLAIDADPALGITYAIDAKPAVTIWDIREALKEGPGRKELLSGDRDIPLKDIIRDRALMKMEGFDFLVMGRSEGPGCFCGINDLLRYAIDSMVQSYDIVLVDCEAGIEQVNRRALRNTDTLMLVTDPTVRGIQTVRRLEQIAREYSADRTSFRTGLLFNRVDDESVLDDLKKDLAIDIWGCLPDDPTIKKFDLEGKSLLNFPEASPAYQCLKVVVPTLLASQKLSQ
jgi:CO dehydrogenase maturation factor